MNLSSFTVVCLLIQVVLKIFPKKGSRELSATHFFLTQILV